MTEISDEKKELCCTIPEDVDTDVVRKKAQKHLLERGLIKDIGVGTDE